MKTKTFKLMYLTYIVSALFIFSMSSCAVKTHFLTSQVVPAAQGTVQVKTDKYNNYVIKIDISNLSPSDRLTPPAKAYVVWLITTDKIAKNLGQLNSSKSFMSNDLSAQFEAISSSKPEKIVITAEDDPSVEYPSFSKIILTTNHLSPR